MPESSLALRDFHRVVEAVQSNCDIADARHAREMPLCNYLLGMRELYRWEHELPFSQIPSKEEVGAWLTRREAQWNGMEDMEFRRIPVEGKEYDPFDSAMINRALVPRGLVYGGGYGRRGFPNFFLAQLGRQEGRSGLKVLVSGCEFARGIAAPPAALNNGIVFLRMDAMQRWLWGRFEAWDIRAADDAFKAAFECYGEGSIETKLGRMAAQEAETLILHEMGEAIAEPLLGAAWREMLGSFAGRRAEALVRAVRDNLADCLVTLPELVRRRENCSVHFYFATFDGLRSSLFPRLREGYEQWCESGNGGVLDDIVTAGRTHWQGVAQRLLDAWRDDPSGAEAKVEHWIEHSAWLAL